MIVRRVGIIDYNICNLNSVIRAFEEINVEVKIVTSKKNIYDCSHLVLPGVGSFQKGIENLNNLDLVIVLMEWVKSGKPLLGICLGMQLLADIGYEFTETEGLGLIEGSIMKLRSDHEKFILPHVGWNSVENKGSNTLLKNIDDNNSFYFVHSYGYKETTPYYVKGLSNYFTSIVSIIEKENIFGVQFHPEKSQKKGLKLLKNFIEFKC